MNISTQRTLAGKNSLAALSSTLNLDHSLNFHAGMSSYFQAWEDNVRLGALSVFSPQASTAELGAFVFPPHRRKGVLTALLAEAKPILRAYGCQFLLFPCDSKSETGEAVAAHWGLSPEHAEYQMIYSGTHPTPSTRGLTLRPGVAADLHALTNLYVSANGGDPETTRGGIFKLIADPDTLLRTIWQEGQLVGAANVNRASPLLSIYGVAVSRAAQSRGVGRALMYGLLDELSADYPQRGIFLEVDSQNPRALHLYSSSGFTVRQRIDYYCAPLK